MLFAVAAPAVVVIGIIKVISDNNTRRRAIEAGAPGDSVRSRSGPGS